MPPVFFVSLPFILLLLVSRGGAAKPAPPKSTKTSVEKVLDIVGDDNEIIIVCNKKSKTSD